MKTFTVIGLGRFGTSIATQLFNMGYEVLAIDKNMDKINAIANLVTRAACTDAKDESLLKQLGVKNSDCAIVCIGGDDITDSVLTTLALKDMGVKQVVCKAKDNMHKTVLKKVGADNVIIPEQEAGIKAAIELVSDRLLDIIELSDEYIDAIRQQLPELPEAKKARYKNEYGLTEYDTDMICSSVSYVRLFERTVEITGNPKDSAHWIMGEVMKLLNDSQTLPEDMRFNSDALGRIIQLQNGNKISRDSAKKVLAAVFTDNVDPDEYVKQNQMEMVSDTGAIRKVVEDVLAQNEKAVNEYKGGKAASFNFLIGQCMRALRGKAPAAEVTKILKEILG